jgi:hypothetical protein
MNSPLNQVKAYLLNGGALTVKSCWQLFGTTEMRKIASRLRQQGHNIVTTRLTDILPDGRSVQFNEYRIKALE